MNHDPDGGVVRAKVVNEAQAADSSRNRRSMFIWIGLMLAGSLLVVALLALPRIPKDPPVERGQQDIPADGVLVLTARETLAAGSTLRPGDVTFKHMPYKKAASHGIRMDDISLSISDVVGRQLKSDVHEGHPLLNRHLYPKGHRHLFPKGNMTRRLPTGYRGYTLAVDLLGEYITIGTSVDVLFRTDPRRFSAALRGIPETTLALVEGAEVIHLERPRESLPTPIVTLSVTAQEAQILLAAEGRGTFALAARSQGTTRSAHQGYRDRFSLESLFDVDVLGRLKPGYRAFRLEFTETLDSTVATGNQVDVLFRADERAAGGGHPALQEKTISLIHRAEVIHVERPESDVPVTLVTLGVTPKQAQALLAAKGHGQFVLTALLRDESLTFEPANKGELTLEDLLNNKKPITPW